MKIGYSFWGFLGPGILDTPDGGRSHRRTLIDTLRAAPTARSRREDGHDVVFLQANRDLREAGLDLRNTYTWDAGLPALDCLFLEWRWPIAERNTTECGTAGHTCDLHRQAELIRHYTVQKRTPTLLWDKDLQLPQRDPLRRFSCVTVCEAALHPTPGARSLLFPVDDAVLDDADPVALAAKARPLPMAYVGNQYDRDDAFTRFFAPAAAHLPHRVAGKWTRTSDWPHVTFSGRCSFEEVEKIYSTALATVLLLPERYTRAGQMTQRIFEAVLAGCLPLTPATIHDAATFTPASLHVRDSEDVVAVVQHLGKLAGTSAHADLIAACLHRLDIFRVSRQVKTISQVMAQ
jgi:hypothetical protein